MNLSLLKGTYGFVEVVYFCRVGVRHFFGTYCLMELKLNMSARGAAIVEVTCLMKFSGMLLFSVSEKGLAISKEIRELRPLITGLIHSSSEI